MENLVDFFFFAYGSLDQKSDAVLQRFNSLPLQDSDCYSPYSPFAGQLPTRLQTESEQGMPGFHPLPLLQHMQVILNDDSFEEETMNCVHQTFSQRLKTGAWQKRGAGKH